MKVFDRSARRTAWGLLLLQALLLFTFLAYSSRAGVTRYVDTRTYEEALLPNSFAGKLQSMRTLGYPLFLAAVKAIHPTYEMVMVAQVGLFVLGVLAFARGFELFSGSAWLALAAATPALHSPLLVVYGAAMLADVLAAGLALALVGALFWLLARPTSGAAWMTLTLALFLTYQTRPSYLFLLVWVPLAGLLIRWRRLGPRPALSFTWGLTAVALVPFLAWCGLRWSLTGHFGLVSFGGVNLVGLTTSMLSPSVVGHLPPEHQALGRHMLAGRASRGLKTDGELRFGRWVNDYNRNVWRIAVRSAARWCARPGQTEPEVWAASNRCLNEFSWAVVRLRPGLYARWVVTAFFLSLRDLGASLLISGTALMLAVASAVRVLRDRLGRKSPIRAAPAAGTDFLIVASLYLAGSLGLVVLVEAPIDRYLWAAALFLPGAFTTLAVELLFGSPPPVPGSR